MPSKMPNRKKPPIGTRNIKCKTSRAKYWWESGLTLRIAFIDSIAGSVTRIGENGGYNPSLLGGDRFFIRDFFVFCKETPRDHAAILA
jgi:hypothetical protein